MRTPTPASATALKNTKRKDHRSDRFQDSTSPRRLKPGLATSVELANQANASQNRTRATGFGVHTARRINTYPITISQKSRVRTFEISSTILVCHVRLVG